MYIPPTEFERALHAIGLAIAHIGPTPTPADRAFVIISVCLDRGLNTKDRICKVAKGANENTRQVAAVLDQTTGDNPDLYPWYLEEGRYWKHPC
jgi:hypothetical protein